MNVPADLEKRVFERFDALVESGDVFYEESEAEMVDDGGFVFRFHVLPYLAKKPFNIQSLGPVPGNGLEAPDPAQASTFNPFLHPRPEETITTLNGTHHVLINKYSPFRPMLVVTTIEFAPQDDDLGAADLDVAWTLLRAFQGRQMLAIYNCGRKAGASQKHKHVQIVPLIGNDRGRDLWPASVTETGSSVEGVGFAHFAGRVDEVKGFDGVCETYMRLLIKTKEFLNGKGLVMMDCGYNIAFCRKWMVLIPRRRADVGGVPGANTLGMLGVVTVGSREERDGWTRFGCSEYLKAVGFSWT